MTPSERRTALIRVLSSIDQQITEAESLASDPILDASERVLYDECVATAS